MSAKYSSSELIQYDTVVAMISFELLSIFIYVGLLFLTMLIQATYSSRTAGMAYNLSNHEKPQPNKGPIGIRIDNTLHNLKEGALMYVPLAMLVLHFDISNTWTQYAALATIVSRVLYVPTYIVGIEKLRTLIFIPSLLAIPAIAVGLYVGVFI